MKGDFSNEGLLGKPRETGDQHTPGVYGGFCPDQPVLKRENAYAYQEGIFDEHTKEHDETHIAQGKEIPSKLAPWSAEGGS